MSSINVTQDFNFSADDKDFGDILFSNKRFEIPRYQRQYSWTDDNILDFWNDLTDAESSYFIGSFVLNIENKDEKGVIEVIDGQQRILAITIFMAVIRDLFKSIGAHDDASRLQRQCIENEDRRGSTGYRIKCGDRIQDYFEKNIQDKDRKMLKSNPTDKEEIRIKKHYELFMKKINKELDGRTTYDKIEYLQNLWDRVHEIKAIEILITNEDDAYILFETINARGVELTVSDLLKNLIFKKIRPANEGEKDTAKESWKELVENIKDTNNDLQKFLRYYWLSKYSFVSNKRLFRTIKKQIVDYEDFLNNLVKESITFNKFFDTQLSDWEDIRGGDKIYKSLRAIEIMKVIQCHVFFLSLFRSLEKLKKLELDMDVSLIVKFIEKFTFRYFAVCNLPANKVEQLFSRYARNLEEIFEEVKTKKISGEMQRLFEKLKKELEKLNPGEEEFKEKFRELRYKQSEKSRKLIKYTLREINRLQTSGEMKIDFTEVNAEHLLPRSPGKEWNVKRSEIKDYVDKIGNITLIKTEINSKMGNKSLKEKVELLKESEIVLTSNLAKKIEEKGYQWGEEEIVERQQQLATIANNQVWNLDNV